MKYVPEYLLLTLLAAVPGLPAAAQDADCRPLRIVDYALDGPEKFHRGLLWQISRDGIPRGYVFGTIHVDDKAVVDLPDAVRDSLDGSRAFVMETLPDMQDTLDFSTAMFFLDGTRLDELVSPGVFEKTVDILENYNLSGEMVSIMKPWAAYIIMSYPADMGMVLDFQLLERARRNGAEVAGLESYQEQLDIFGNLPLDDQARILTDTVCHYERVTADLDVMKSLYLERDLEGLYVYSQRYAFDDNTVYDEVAERLISGRNRLMAERMGAWLEAGGAFIAVGAMHLPGEEGVLNLLEERDFTVTRIY